MFCPAVALPVVARGDAVQEGGEDVALVDLGKAGDDRRHCCRSWVLAGPLETMTSSQWCGPQEDGDSGKLTLRCGNTVTSHHTPHYRDYLVDIYLVQDIVRVVCILHQSQSWKNFHRRNNNF